MEQSKSQKARAPLSCRVETSVWFWPLSRQLGKKAIQNWIFSLGTSVVKIPPDRIVQSVSVNNYQLEKGRSARMCYVYNPRWQVRRPVLHSVVLEKTGTETAGRNVVAQWSWSLAHPLEKILKMPRETLFGIIKCDRRVWWYDLKPAPIYEI